MKFDKQFAVSFTFSDEELEALNKRLELANRAIIMAQYVIERELMARRGEL